jgi:hypothetical protein
VVRVAKGPIDLVTMRLAPPGYRLVDDTTTLGFSEVRLVQVKSTERGPFHSFGPAERDELLDLAQQAGATAWLIWWPPFIPFRWIPSSEWP